MTTAKVLGPGARFVFLGDRDDLAFAEPALAHAPHSTDGFNYHVEEFPGSRSVNMRLGPGVVRELHWHKEAEWGYVTQGAFA